MNRVLAMAPGDVASVDVDAAGLTLVCPPSATIGDSMLSRIARSFLMTVVCRYFWMAIAGTVPRMDLTRSVAALIVRSALEMEGAVYNFPTAFVMPLVSHM